MQERCLAQARDEFNCALLDTEIQDAAEDEVNAFVSVALHALYGKSGEPLYRASFAADWMRVEQIVKDVIEQRAIEIEVGA